LSSPEISIRGKTKLKMLFTEGNKGNKTAGCWLAPNLHAGFAIMLCWQKLQGLFGPLVSFCSIFNHNRMRPDKIDFTPRSQRPRRSRAWEKVVPEILRFALNDKRGLFSIPALALFAILV
jgi:hypothetical protein